jgi:predicted PurR-regulated permease PerM
LFGLLLDGMAGLASKWLRLPRSIGLALVVLLLASCVAGFCWLAGPRVLEEGRTLVQRLPHSIEVLRSDLQKYDWARSVMKSLPALDKVQFSFGSVLGSVSQALAITLELAGALLFIFFVGFYLAATPAIYRDAVLMLFSRPHRARAREVMAALGKALRWWLFGRAITMTLMGLLTALALWLVDVPLALVLGVIAGLFLFVPYLGALAAAVPAMLVALMESPAKAFWVAVIYTGTMCSRAIASRLSCKSAPWPCHRPCFYRCRFFPPRFSGCWESSFPPHLPWSRSSLSKPSTSRMCWAKKSPCSVSMREILPPGK